MSADPPTRHAGVVALAGRSTAVAANATKGQDVMKERGMASTLGRVYRAVFLGALALGLCAALPTPGAAAGTALVRLVHASPSSPTVEVYLDGQRVITSMAFAETTAYVAVPAGSHRVTVYAIGTGPGGSPLLDEAAELQEANAYTLVGAEESGKMLSLLLTDARKAPAQETAFLRVVHASPDVPAIVDVAVAGGPIFARGLAFRSAGDYLPTTPGTYRFEVRPAGTVQPLATTAPLGVDAGKQYTVVVIGRLVDNSFQALTLDDNLAFSGVSAMPIAGGGGGAGRSGAGVGGFALAGALLALLLLPRLRPVVVGRAARRG